MKGQVSRISQDRSKRYSAVFQNQGAMVTDADLGEASFIARARTDELGNEAIGDGAPMDGGAVAVTRVGNDDFAALRPGLVYADGVRGTVRLAESQTLGPGALDLYLKQRDFPMAPVLPSGDRVIYADVWHQDRFPLSDPGLVDPGFHGAETSFRSRTVAQIKAAPLADRAQIGIDTGPYPRKGDGLIRAELLAGAAAIDPCDPCAAETPESLRLGNALFRVEVLAVTGPAHDPEGVTIAWSMENAAEQMATSPAPPSAFTGRVGSVFEFFSDITEAHKGAFADPATRRHSRLENGWPATVPVRTDGGGASAWPMVRRWDGYAEIDLKPAPTATVIRNGTFSVDGGRLKITLTSLAFQLDLAGKRVLVGDYWLAEVREFAAAADRIRVVGEIVEGATPRQALPVGIDHHYAVLFTATGAGASIALTDPDRRAASFPSLDNLPASHVGYDNHCNRLYGLEPQMNVQEALDALCAIDASKIPFDNNCPNIFNDADTVQEALDALCGLDLSGRIDYRLLFDWGVLCGIDVVENKPQTGFNGPIIIKPGAFLDRRGNLVRVTRDIHINVITGDNVEVRPDFSKVKTPTEFCLCLRYNDDRSISVHVVVEEDCWLPQDLTADQRAARCREGKKDFRDILDGLVAEEDTTTRRKFLLAATAEEPLMRSYRMSRDEDAEIARLLGKLEEEIRSQLPEDEQDWLSTALVEVEAANDPANAGPAAADYKRAARAVGKMGVMTEGAQRIMDKCACDNHLPACPPDIVAARDLVPIACITINEYGGLSSVCPLCCRRQALTPRTLRYWRGDEFLYEMGVYAEHCCPKGFHLVPEGPKGPGDIRVEGWKPAKPPRQVWPEWPTPWRGPRPGPPPELVNPPRPEGGGIIWSDKPDVNDLAREPAIQVLQGHGVDVIELIDLDEGDPLAALAEKGKLSGPERMAEGDAISPGDKVALLMQDGVSRGYVVLERGEGRYAFPTGGDKVKPQFDLTDIEGALSEARAEKQTLGLDLAELEKRRETLAGEVLGLKAEVDGMRGEQEDFAARILATTETKTRLDREIAVLAAERRQLTEGVAELRELYGLVKADGDRMLADIDKVREEFKSLAKERDKLVVSVRAAQPVLSLANEQPDIVLKLQGAGSDLGTVGDLSAMPTAERNKLLTDAGLTTAERTALMRTINARLKP